MSKNAYPVLCGGTFFTLVLEARKPRSGKKEQLYGTRDGLSEPEVLSGLVKVMYPEFVEPSSDTTFKTNTSDYKVCKNNGGNLPFFDKEIRAFDNRVKTDYQTALIQMLGFVNGFIEVGGSVKRDEWLVKALLDLVASDQSISDTDAFYICENGSVMTRATLRDVSVVCLPAFLLGIWHFAVVHRQENTIGRDTFDKWCPSNNRKPRVYIGGMGNSITKPISVTMPDGAIYSGNSENFGDEPTVEYSEPFIKEPNNEPTSNTTTQIINSPAVFFNSGANGVQINNTGTLNIDRGGKT